MQTLFSYLPLLACPLGMGLMMVMMGRMASGNKDKSIQGMQVQSGDVATNQPSTAVNPDDRLTMLHVQLDDVQGQIARLAAEDRMPEQRGSAFAPALIGHGTSAPEGR